MKSKNFLKSFKGFTLIELLIVITIIGILAVAIVPTILGTPARARDVARQGHLNQIAAAIEIFVLDGGSYPGTAAGDAICIDDGAEFVNIAAKVQGAQLPVDPSSTAMIDDDGSCTDGQYVYVRLGAENASYALFAKVENTANGNYGTTPILTGGNDPATDVAGAYYIIVK